MGDAPLFVVQEHNASRLHYDFRLEVGGRLVSWAVPRGPSTDPGERRLAVRVEDHPVEWGEFEGVIADGQYGAGEVIVWDRGTWKLLGDETAEDALEHGKLLILLGGRKLRGRFVLIRTESGKLAWEGGRENWLLMKLKDRYATPGEQVTEQHPQSVVTGRTIADLQQWAEDLKAVEAEVPKLKGAKAEAMPDAPSPTEGVVALCNDLDVRVVNAKGKDLTGSIPDVVAFLKGMRLPGAVFEGEMHGTSYRVRDLLHFAGMGLADVPLAERQRLLSKLVPDHGPVEYLAPKKGVARAKASSAEVQSTGDAPALAEKIREPGHRSLELNVGGATVKLTNLDKVFWPEADGRPAILKRDFIAYYAEVGPWIVPYLADRPLTLRRYVDGAMGKAFYQRNWHEEAPDFVRLVPIWATTPGRDFHAVVCDNLATLLWLANTADLEMHAWYSRIASDGEEWAEDCAGSEEAAEACALNYPDYVVFDLDPWIKAAREPGSADRLAALAACKQVAGMVRGELEAKGLSPFIKTSGKTGLHILAPIERRYRFEETREFARRIGADLAKEHPDEVSVEWRIAKRTGHVLVDHMQNVRAKTLPAPYSLRASEVASVSMPLRWEELDAADSHDFTLRTVPAILRERGDAWEGLLDHRAAL